MGWIARLLCQYYYNSALIRMNPVNFMDNDDNFLAYQVLKRIILSNHKEPQCGGGSTMGRGTFNRQRLEGNLQLPRDHFAENPTYLDEYFCRQFRTHRIFFLRVLNNVVAYNHYFVQKQNTAGQLGLSPHQKICCTVRMLAYGCSADSLDEYFRMAESTALESLK
ncbi:hypothetical protein PSTG_03966 [Puccinia striiformis f. sp. tritici PST-78]|uniref:Uncharacterized protein n=1 Tax=Puccinia striiformis f. sp. tritici PST-78 TaxID=1165861 RepID=A0A0L0VUK5_9BASI|nr:hypothetical protein PSTG_03966 [Puccinia striiformis f. sp. tritici PST-78]